MLGYQDVNNVVHLHHHPPLKGLINISLDSQPTISHFENRMDRWAIFAMSNK